MCVAVERERMSARDERHASKLSTLHDLGLLGFQRAPERLAVTLVAQVQRIEDGTGWLIAATAWPARCFRSEGSGWIR